MATLEQIKLLESRLTRAINFVARLTEENSRLKKRNDELEEANAALREEKTRVEEGIVSALRKLNQFEDAIEKSFSSTANNSKPVHQETISQAKTSVAPVTSGAAEKAKPVVPSAYIIDEEDDTTSKENTHNETTSILDIDTAEDSGEAELDIF